MRPADRRRAERSRARGDGPLLRARDVLAVVLFSVAVAAAVWAIALLLPDT